jgi:hypothetical protein
VRVVLLFVVVVVVLVWAAAVIGDMFITDYDPPRELYAIPGVVLGAAAFVLRKYEPAPTP